MDLAGKVVLQRNTHPGENRIHVSSNDLAGGVYLVRYMQSTGKTFTRKVIIR